MEEEGLSRQAPTVSVIVPVSYGAEGLERLLAQTLADFEVLCVDDGSTDSSPEILADLARRDSRVQVSGQVGALRGRYVYFPDADGLCRPELLERAVARAEETEADIVAFQVSGPQGARPPRTEIHLDWLAEGTQVFCYRDCPDRILSVVAPRLGNRLYRTRFLEEGGFPLGELGPGGETALAAVTVAAAERVAVLPQPLLDRRAGQALSSAGMGEVICAVSAVLRQAAKLPHYGEIRFAVGYFALEQYGYALMRYRTGLSDPEARAYYTEIRNYLLGPEFDGLTREQFAPQALYHWLQMLRRYDFDRFRELCARRLVVSLTSYPRRIGGVAAVLETIYQQTLPPDEVVLWLAEEQFPNGLADLPEALQKLSAEGRLTLRWCDDLKPHKKYFYAFQQYPEDVIVTVDDDILYHSATLEELFECYLFYPEAVSAGRAHLMAIEPDGKILPYNLWVQGTEGSLYQPSMQLFATGVLGVLYPPHLLDLSLLDREAIVKTCLYADDLWLKAMELLSDVPVVLARGYEPLHYLPGSQAEALYHDNVDRNANDVQLEQIIRWVDGRFGPGTLEKKLTQSQVGVPLLGMEVLCHHMAIERGRMKGEARRLNRKLQQTYGEKSELNRRLQQAYGEKSELNRKLQQAYAEKSEGNRKLQQAYAEKSELNRRLQQAYAEKSEVNRRLQQTYAEKSELNGLLRQARSEKSRLKQQLRQEQRERKELEEQLARAREANRRLKASAAYRLGRVLTWPVRKLKGLFRKK